MPINFPRHTAALALALAMFLQGLGLVFMDKLTPGQTIQWLAISLAVAALTHEAWRNRRRLDHRVDMAIVMIAFGGLGMLAGMGVDHALARGRGAAPMAMHGGSMAMTPMANTPGTPAAASDTPSALPACCADEGFSTTAPGRPTPQSGLTWTGFKASLFSWMTALMLLGGIPPTWFMTRCARLASLDWRRWLSTHILGNAGMIVGMIAFGKWFGAGLSMKLGAMMSGRHLAMLVGMFVGMELFQFAAEAVLGLKPWQKLDIPVDDAPVREQTQITEPIDGP